MTNYGQDLGQTVTLLTTTVTGQDTDHNDILGEVSYELAGCSVWPRTSSEIVQGQDTTIIGVNVLVPTGSLTLVGAPMPTAQDRMLVAGVKYEIDGLPGHYANPISGDDGGVQVQLTRVTG